MFTIYHIPGIKVGCTKRSVSKRVKEQGYSEYEILGTYESIEEAGLKEREFQNKLGYKFDSNELYNERYTANGIKTSLINKENGNLAMLQKKGGKSQGEINKQTGHIYELQLKNSKIPKKSWDLMIQRNLEYKICPYCGIKTRGLGYDRWHGEKCKNKK